MNEANRNKLLLSNSLWIFVIRFFSTAASLALMFFYAHHLATNIYGVYQNFWVQLTVVAAIANIGLGLLIFTYSPDTLRYLIRQISKKQLLLYALLLLLIGLLFSGLRSSNFGEWKQTGYTHFLLFLFFSFSLLLETILIVARKYRLLIFSSILYATLFLFIGFFVFNKGFNIVSFEQYLLLILIVKTSFYFYFFLQFLNTKTSVAVQSIDINKVKSLWLNLSFYDLFTVFVVWIDKFIISIFASSSTAAIYFNGSFPIPFIPILLSAVGNASLMQLNTANNGAQKATIMRQAGSILATVVYPIFFFLLIYRAEFIRFVFSEKYEASVPIFLCSLFILPVRAYSNTAILQNAHEGATINIGILIDFCVALIIMYPLYQLLGLAGIALSFVISTYVQVAYYLYHSAQKLGLAVWALIPLKSWTIKALGFGTLIFSLHFLLRSFSEIWSMTTTFIIVSILSILLILSESKTKKSKTTNGATS